MEFDILKPTDTIQYGDYLIGTHDKAKAVPVEKTVGYVVAEIMRYSHGEIKNFLRPKNDEQQTIPARV